MVSCGMRCEVVEESEKERGVMYTDARNHQILLPPLQLCSTIPNVTREAYCLIIRCNIKVGLWRVRIPPVAGNMKRHALYVGKVEVPVFSTGLGHKI